jgi:hypothetical protein
MLNNTTSIIMTDNVYTPMGVSTHIESYESHNLTSPASDARDIIMGITIDNLIMTCDNMLIQNRINANEATFQYMIDHMNTIIEYNRLIKSIQEMITNQNTPSYKSELLTFIEDVSNQCNHEESLDDLINKAVSESRVNQTIKVNPVTEINQAYIKMINLEKDLSTLHSELVCAKEEEIERRAGGDVDRFEGVQVEVLSEKVFDAQDNLETARDQYMILTRNYNRYINNHYQPMKELLALVEEIKNTTIDITSSDASIKALIHNCEYYISLSKPFVKQPAYMSYEDRVNKKLADLYLSKSITNLINKNLDTTEKGNLVDTIEKRRVSHSLTNNDIEEAIKYYIMTIKEHAEHLKLKQKEEGRLLKEFQSAQAKRVKAFEAKFNK